MENKIIRRKSWMKVSLMFTVMLSILIPPILASVTYESVEESYNIKTTDILKTSYKEIELKLLKEGLSYNEVSNVFIPEDGGYILFLLPEGKDFDKLDLYDLKTKDKDRLIEFDDITKIENCRSYYMTQKINDTWTILVCPKIENNEVQIKIESLLYHGDCGCSYGNYYIPPLEINAGIKKYLKENFEVKFRLLIDDLFYFDEGLNFEGSCSNFGLNERIVYNGVICEGRPNISEALVFTNISLNAWDKEFVYRKQQIEKERENLLIVLLIGVVIAFFIVIYGDILKELGTNLYKNKKKWNGFLFWIHLLVTILGLIYLILVFYS